MPAYHEPAIGPGKPDGAIAPWAVAVTVIGLCGDCQTP